MNARNQRQTNSGATVTPTFRPPSKSGPEQDGDVNVRTRAAKLWNDLHAQHVKVRAEENAWNSSQGKVARSNEDTKLEDQVDETDGRWEPQKEQAQLELQLARRATTAGKEADLQLVKELSANGRQEEHCQLQARTSQGRTAAAKQAERVFVKEGSQPRYGAGSDEDRGRVRGTSARTTNLCQSVVSVKTMTVVNPCQQFHVDAGGTERSA